MGRIQEILKHTDLAGMGIEIAPYFNPILRKSDGHNIKTLDIFDTERLFELARKDPNIPDHRISEIEPVDFVGDAADVGQLVAATGLSGQFDYVLSSHNFEHLSNPIRFLQSAAEVLKEGGTLSMAVPDYRRTLDFFRMPTRLADWLNAYHEGHTQPQPETIFDHYGRSASYHDEDGETHPAIGLESFDPNRFIVDGDLKDAYQTYVEDKKTPRSYHDSHCSVFFDVSLELNLLECQYLGLIPFEIIEVSPRQGLEFFVHLRKSSTASDMDKAVFDTRRTELMQAVAEGMGKYVRKKAPLNDRLDLLRSLKHLERTMKRSFGTLIGRERAKKIDQWWIKLTGK